jgi:hypothetical protein
MAGLAAAMVVAIGPRAWAQSMSDIVWPTYDQIDRASDTGLNCTALQAEIGHVAADIGVLRKAQTRTEDALHSAFDMERYGGSRGPGGMRVSSGAVNGKEVYATAREQIVASLKIAQKRRDRLKALEPDCKPAPQPISTP